MLSLNMITQADGSQTLLVLEVEASITGEMKRELDLYANGWSAMETRAGPLKRTRSQYDDDQNDIDEKSILGDFAAIVAEHSWEFDFKLGKDTAACLSALKRWQALERRLREQSKTSYKVLSPRGTTITQTGIKGVH